jgi:hypothetical protein
LAATSAAAAAAAAARGAHGGAYRAEDIAQLALIESNTQQRQPEPKLPASPRRARWISELAEDEHR